MIQFRVNVWSKSMLSVTSSKKSCMIEVISFRKKKVSNLSIFLLSVPPIGSDMGFGYFWTDTAFKI